MSANKNFIDHYGEFTECFKLIDTNAFGAHVCCCEKIKNHKALHLSSHFERYRQFMRICFFKKKRTKEAISILH
jgi:hypothetical protein